jgi:hypothetical protein
VARSPDGALCSVREDLTMTPAHRWPADFDPTLLSHGRLLWRFPGSDGARFSPRLAWSLLDEFTGDVSSDIARGVPGIALWDPFCGTGLIPAVAMLFFGERLAEVHASDMSELASSVAQENLQLVSDPKVAERRMREVTGRRGQNPKSDRRWGEVATYLEALKSRIEAAHQRAVPIACWAGPADQVPATDHPLCIVADAPYGAQSTLHGSGLAELVTGWLMNERVNRIVLVMGAALPEAPRAAGFECSQRPIRGGRTVLIATRTRPTDFWSGETSKRSASTADGMGNPTGKSPK